MYLGFYNFMKEPFNVTPDPDFFYLSPSHKEALGSIIYGIEQRKGFIAVIGEIGLGKTTVLRTYLERANRPELRLIYIFNSNISFASLLKLIFQELGLEADAGGDVFEMVNRLHEVLIDEYKDGRNVVLIIDEAQNMPTETLENLRMLSNLETSREKLIQILLIGQPELQEKLNCKELRQLNQRIAIRTRLSPLTSKESLNYINYRLNRAALKEGRVFTRRALGRIIKEAKGVPRVINILCDNALITGFGYNRKVVNIKIVREVIRDYSTGNRKASFRYAMAVCGLFLLLAATALSLLYYLPDHNHIKSWLMNRTAGYWIDGGRIESTTQKNVYGSNEIVRAIPSNSISSRTQGVAAPLSREIPAADPESNSKAQPVAPTAEGHQQNETNSDVGPEELQNEQAEATPVEISDENIAAIETPAKTESQPSETESPNPGSFRLIAKRGDTLIGLIREKYGFIDRGLLDSVRSHNPHIRNLNRIPVGTEIFFPELTGSSLRQLEDEDKAKF